MAISTSSKAFKLRYKAEERIGNHWESLDLMTSELGPHVQRTKSIRLISGNPVRVVELNSPNVIWTSGGTDERID